LLASASNLKLKSVANDPDNSQISSTFYSTKTDLGTHHDDDSDPLSPSASDTNGPLPPPPPPQQIPHQLRVLHADTKISFPKLTGRLYKNIFLQKKIKIYVMLIVPDFLKEKEI
jgi:hypothetical protein